jgi:DNA helicase II / ATP-dependent DNA helicase PcrA
LAYVLEDEAQDSVPLQEILLSNLTGTNGNWVRVGDPNQAITSSFTAANPRFFNEFIDLKSVVSKPLPNSGRSAALIIGAANAVLDWVIDQHPVPEVRRYTFRRQHILPTPPGDSQPNPPDDQAGIRIKVYQHREDEELPTVAQLAAQYAIKNPQHTLAILVPTHNLGHKVTDHLDDLDAPYDSLLRGGIRERGVSAVIQSLLSVLANPLDTNALANAFGSLHELEHPITDGVGEELSRLQTIIRSVHQPETLLFPWDEGDRMLALPAGVATTEEARLIERFALFMEQLFNLRPLPIDDLALALGDELFAYETVYEGDLAIAYQIAGVLRYWREMQPEWRLPQLAEELADVVSGRRKLPLARPSDYGYEPQPGRITVSTQHSAKGVEWDAVYLVGIDGYWIPTDLQASFRGEYEFLGGDPQAEANAQLGFLMKNDTEIYVGRSATESAHIEIISERLRLLYVGITRARHYLHISRSRTTRQYNKEKEAAPATVLGALYQYLKGQNR